MQKIKAVISYDGNEFLGFQAQKYTKKTVIGVLQDELLKLKIDSKINGSGRTDRGVHALNQVIDFKVPPFWKDLKKLHLILNKHCFKHGIHFKTLAFVDNEFHSRYSAKKRSYFYIIKQNPKVFEQKYVAYYKDFDLSLLNKAVKTFIGSYDFEYFCKTGSSVKSYKRELFYARAIQYKDTTLVYFKANGFLRSQVRLMVGAALEVATHKRSLQQLQKQLLKKQRVFTKPSQENGLYLSKVLY